MNEERPALHVVIFYWCVLAIEVVSFRLSWLEERIFVRIDRFQRRRAGGGRPHARQAQPSQPQTGEQKSPLRTL